MFFTFFFLFVYFLGGNLFVHVWGFGGVFFCLFLPHCTASWILFLPPGIKAGPPAVEARIPNHLITREVL